MVLKKIDWRWIGLKTGAHLLALLPLWLMVRATLADVAETIADSYDLNVRFAASSFWENMISQL